MEKGVKCFFCEYVNTGDQKKDVQHLQRKHDKVQCCVCHSYYDWNHMARLEQHFKDNRDHCRTFMFCHKTNCLIRIYPKGAHKCIKPLQEKPVEGEGASGTSNLTN